MAKLLVVDDEDAVLKSMRRLLLAEGHEVIAIADGNAASDLIKTQSYDLLVTDIRMAPVDGMELIKLARSKKPPLPVIIVSAYGSEKTEKQAFALGCTAYIQKPFKVQDIIDAIRKALPSVKA